MLLETKKKQRAKFLFGLRIQSFILILLCMMLGLFNLLHNSLQKNLLVLHPLHQILALLPTIYSCVLFFLPFVVSKIRFSLSPPPHLVGEFIIDSTLYIISLYKIYMSYI